MGFPSVSELNALDGHFKKGKPQNQSHNRRRICCDDQITLCRYVLAITIVFAVLLDANERKCLPEVLRGPFDNHGARVRTRTERHSILYQPLHKKENSESDDMTDGWLTHVFPSSFIRKAASMISFVERFLCLSRMSACEYSLRNVQFSCLFLNNERLRQIWTARALCAMHR